MRLFLASSLFSLVPLSIIYTPGTNAESVDISLRQNAQLDSAQARKLAQAQGDAQVKKRLSRELPAGVRKMTYDEGEKFWLRYWYFGSDTTSLEKKDAYDLDNTSEHEGESVPELGTWANDSSLFRPAFPLHGSQGNISPMMKIFGRSLPSFQKRDYRCPKDTEACDSISRPNSCCQRGSVCHLVEDTGLGDVGCCGEGDKCAGELSLCDHGYSSCSGGGCCIPGYNCVDQGCIRLETTTVYVAPTSTSSRPSTSPSETSIQPPVRPTSNPTITMTTDSSTSTYFTGYCPTGFYACGAVYQGGCCRIGRDCHSTSCPSLLSTTVVDANGATIVIPVAPTATDSERCAQGWSLCADNVGGGCCPNGYACEKDNCSAPGPGAQPTIGKIPAQDAASKGSCLGIWKFMLTGSVVIITFLI